MIDPTQQLVDTLEQLLEHNRSHKLETYKPYPYQEKFHNAQGHRTGQPAQVKALIAANQIGKTLSACVEDVYHLTGLYPVWWKGFRFKRPIQAVIGTYTNELTRDVLQAELCGDPFEPDALGTGWIPKHLMDVNPTKKAGVPQAFDTVLVKHVTGGYSKISFRSYDIGAQKFYGRRVDLYHLDEEPPRDVFDQCVRGTLSRQESLINLTFTAEHGKTELWMQLRTEQRLGHFAMGATWEDALHFQDPEVRKREEAKIPKRLLKLRTKGIPVMGSGLIYPFPDDELACDPFEIPPYWPRIKAIDFGVSHAFALVTAAWDRDTDTWYIYEAKKKEDLNIATMAAMLNATDKWIPVVWPHDLNKRDARSGKTWKTILASHPYECNMCGEVFSNPTDEWNKQGGGQAIWAGIYAMRQWMEEGRFKVFVTQSDFFEEKDFYHEDEKGKPVERNDDIMDACRYGFQMRRFAVTRPRPRRRKKRAAGLTNW